jgi:hypothetical protein
MRSTLMGAYRGVARTGAIAASVAKTGALVTVACIPDVFLAALRCNKHPNHDDISEIG